MKYKDGRKYRRRIGQSRKSQSIYDNLGHPFDIKGKIVLFIGKEEKSYCLTKNKQYKIISATSGKCCFDYSMDEKHKNNRRIQTDQSEDYLITIINDKGHKRQYSHLMFKLEEIK